MKRSAKTKERNLTTQFIGSAVAYAVATAVVRHWYRHWGATPEEESGPLPGDEFAKQVTSTRAITINAPVEDVWKWLVQIGQDRAGFYSYDVLERVVLADIHNVDRIVPEWQDLKAGDTVRLASQRAYGDGPLLTVLALEPNHYFVLERWGAFVLRRVDDLTTRMIFRSHSEERSRLRKMTDFLFLEPLHFVMERRMMMGIKERAERMGDTSQLRRIGHAGAA